MYKISVIFNNSIGLGEQFYVHYGGLYNIACTLEVTKIEN